MDYKNYEMPNVHIAYMRQTGPYGESNRALMEKFKSWTKQVGLYKPTAVILGIIYDNPETVPPEKCRYDVCIIVPEHFAVTDEDVHNGILRGGKYAVFTIDHTAPAICEAWSKIFAQLSSDGIGVDTSRTVIERYIPEMVDRHLCEICVPI